MVPPGLRSATGLARVDYVMLLPTAEQCIVRVQTRHGHAFSDENATRKMHDEFARCRHCLPSCAPRPGGSR